MTGAAWRALVLLGAAAALGGRPGAQPPGVTPPDWASPRGVTHGLPPDSVTLRHVPGSPVAFTVVGTRDLFSVPDWFPATHPPMPPVVAHGRRPAVWACGYCHLPDGAGRPENAPLAGLPADYIVRQVAAMRDGTRGSPWHAAGTPWSAMRAIAESTSDAEVAAAARYFAAVPLRRRARVVEAARIPRLLPAVGLYFFATEGGEEILGQRLVEVAGDATRHELHDASVVYTTYAPPGSIARGRTLALQGVPGTVAACASCHGAELRGVGSVPPLAGRSPSYLLRQLVSFAAGTRTGPVAAPMRAVAGALGIDDMIAAAAYAGSRTP
ncbi:MAG TPA: hypothetical protein VGD56_14750 [Gemmatirosa sp.]